MMKDKIELTEVNRYAKKSEVESGLIEKKLKKLEKQQKRRLNSQKRHQAKEAKLYGK